MPLKLDGMMLAACRDLGVRLRASYRLQGRAFLPPITDEATPEGRR